MTSAMVALFTTKPINSPAALAMICLPLLLTPCAQSHP